MEPRELSGALNQAGFVRTRFLGHFLRACDATDVQDTSQRAESCQAEFFRSPRISELRGQPCG